MKKMLLLIPALLLVISSLSFAEPVRDWRDLKAVHEKVKQSIKDMERARAANHYDMGGHGVKAEELLRQVEHELHEAIESARQAK